MMKKIGLILFLACLALLLYGNNIAHATYVCLSDQLNVVNNFSPNINYSISSGYFYNYDVTAWKWNTALGRWDMLYNSGTVGAPSVYPGNYTHIIPSGVLPVDGGWYAAMIVIWDGYAWGNWAEGYFILNNPGVCGTANGGVSCSTAGDRGGTLCASGSVVGMTAVNCGWYWQCSGAPPSPTCKSFRSVPLGSCGSIPF